MLEQVTFAVLLSVQKSTQIMLQLSHLTTTFKAENKKKKDQLLSYFLLYVISVLMAYLTDKQEDPVCFIILKLNKENNIKILHM